MGANVSKALGKIFGNKEMRILMLGLDAAGKTSKDGPFIRCGWFDIA
jgi:ADP-ribosylation factor family